MIKGRLALPQPVLATAALTRRLLLLLPLWSSPAAVKSLCHAHVAAASQGAAPHTTSVAASATTFSGAPRAAPAATLGGPAPTASGARATDHSPTSAPQRVAPVAVAAAWGSAKAVAKPRGAASASDAAVATCNTTGAAPAAHASRPPPPCCHIRHPP